MPTKQNTTSQNIHRKLPSTEKQPQSLKKLNIHGGTPLNFWHCETKLYLTSQNYSTVIQSCNSPHEVSETVRRNYDSFEQTFRYSGKPQVSKKWSFAKLILDLVATLYSVFIMAYWIILQKAILFSIINKISIKYIFNFQIIWVFLTLGGF